MSTLGVTTQPPLPRWLAPTMCRTVSASVRPSKSSPARRVRPLLRTAPGSVRTGAAHDGPRGLPHDLQIQGQRPVLDVAQVQPDRFLPGEVGPPADLPQAGQAGFDGQPARDVA